MMWNRAAGCMLESSHTHVNVTHSWLSRSGQISVFLSTFYLLSLTARWRLNVLLMRCNELWLRKLCPPMVCAVPLNWGRGHFRKMEGTVKIFLALYAGIRVPPLSICFRHLWVLLIVKPWQAAACAGQFGSCRLEFQSLSISWTTVTEPADLISQSGSISNSPNFVIWWPLFNS